MSPARTGRHLGSWRGSGPGASYSDTRPGRHGRRAHDRRRPSPPGRPVPHRRMPIPAVSRISIRMHLEVASLTRSWKTANESKQNENVERTTNYNHRAPADRLPWQTEPGDGSLTLSRLAASIPAAEARRALARAPRPRLFSYEPLGLRNKQPLQRCAPKK